MFVLPMNFSKLSTLLAVLSCCLLVAACSDEPSVQKYRVSKTPVPQSNLPVSAGNAEATDTGLPYTWVVPTGWELGKTSSMRQASYNVPLSNGEVGDFSLVQLGGGAGGTMANINRWRGQVGLEPASPEELAEVAHLHTTGQGEQYLHITLINESNPAAAIAAAIFEQPGFVLFAKMNASSSGIQEAQESFEAFCNSIVFKKL